MIEKIKRAFLDTEDGQIHLIFGFILGSEYFKRSDIIIFVLLLRTWLPVGIGGYLGQMLPEAKRAADSLHKYFQRFLFNASNVTFHQKI
jgi:hypothetical protein